MLGRMKIPKEPKKRKFDPEKFKLQKTWAGKEKNNEIIKITTPPENLRESLLGSFLITVPIASVLSILFIYITQFLFWIPIFFFPVFGILLYKFRSPYSIFEMDRNSDIIRYKGIIEKSGESFNIDYIGSSDIFKSVEVVGRGRSKKKFVRFTTNSGYLRILFLNDEDNEIVNRLSELAFLKTKDIAEKSLKKQKNWHVFYYNSIDRKEKPKTKSQEESPKSKRKLSVEELYEKEYKSSNL